MSAAARVLRAIRLIGDGIVEAVASAGADGCAESTIYLALQQHGGTIQQHEAFVSALVKARKLRRSGHRLYAVDARAFDVREDDCAPRRRSWSDLVADSDPRDPGEDAFFERLGALAVGESITEHDSSESPIWTFTRVA